MEIKHRTELISLLKHFGLKLTGIEVGSAEGYNAKDLMNNGLEFLYLVDNWNKIPGQSGDGGFDKSWHEKNWNDAHDRLKPYIDKVVFLRGLSVDMAKLIPNNCCGLVYIDCDHSFDGVLRDILAYWDKLVDGGIMAFHDYEAKQYGVKEAVHHFVAKTGIEIHLIPENKPEDAGAWIRKPSPPPTS